MELRHKSGKKKTLAALWNKEGLKKAKSRKKDQATKSFQGYRMKEELETA